MKGTNKFMDELISNINGSLKLYIQSLHWIDCMQCEITQVKLN